MKVLDTQKAEYVKILRRRISLYIKPKIICPRNYIYYIYRKGSIFRYSRLKSKRDGLIASIERKNDIVSYGYIEERLNLCGAAISFLSVTVPCDDPIYEKAEEIVASTEGIPKGLTMKQKMGLECVSKSINLEKE